MLMYSGQVIRDGGAAESYSRVYKEMRRVSVVVGWGSCEQVGLNLMHWGCCAQTCDVRDGATLSIAVRDISLPPDERAEAQGLPGF